MFCKKCGNEVVNDQLTCPHYGVALVENVQSAQSEQIILDIDMDFFQNEIYTDGIDSDNFLEDDSFSIWKEDDFVRFLEDQCCLSKEKKIEGRIVKHHVEAYSYWKELINNNKLRKPFKVVHIDAHSDLDYSINNSIRSFLKELDNSKELIVNEEYKKLINSGNYLLCAVSEGLISEVDYVYKEEIGKYLDIIHEDYCCIEDSKKFRFKQNEQIYKRNVLLNTINGQSFKLNELAEDIFDFATVSISPPYVKIEIMGLVNIIKDYINIDELSKSTIDNLKNKSASND